MKTSTRIALAFLIIFILAVPTFATPPTKIPDSLKPWTAWVLHGHEEEQLCTPDYNNPQSLRCEWPSRLELSITDKGGSFRQEWQVESERWLLLPGADPHWPREVKVDGQTALVITSRGNARVWVKPGLHRISGSFSWPEIPVALKVPAHTGLIDLVLRGKRVALPNLDGSGRLWLQAGSIGGEKLENRLTLQVFRLIDDQIPTRLVTNLNLDVAGAAREMVLGPIFDPNAFTPLVLQSRLPARVEADGRLRIQVRPGRWNLTVTARHHTPLGELGFNQTADGFWPTEEIWSFATRTDLRTVEIAGVVAIDPQQTTLPEEWRQYPAYRLTGGDSMRFKEIKRGDPQPAPDQLNLMRNLWLRFDGSGYTIQDTITGKKTTGWRLEANPPLQLGRVAVDGNEQFITRRPGSQKMGVELREGNLNLVTDSLYVGKISALAATGWAHDFQQVKANLMLPPGWRLIHAGGVDNVPATWVSRWTLLDLFIVLILTLAVANLYSKPLAAVALATLALTWHEPQAPRWIWPLLLTGFALLKHLPDSPFRKVVKGGQLLGLLALVVIVVPFAVGQLRVGFFPQLEKPWQAMTVQSERTTAPVQPTSVDEEMRPAEEKEAAQQIESLSRPELAMEKKAERAAIAVATMGGLTSAPPHQSIQVEQYDPRMQLQTGPGLPSWQWNTVAMSWSGPVRSDQRIHLLLLGPKANLALALARVFLLALLPLGLLGIGYRRGSGLQTGDARGLLIFGLLLAVLSQAGPARAAEFPSPELLTELQNRLLEKDKCFPDCVALEKLAINLAPEQLTLDLTISAAAAVAAPLPGDGRYWLPASAHLDGKATTPLLRSGDTLWLKVPAGRHHLKLQGKLAGTNTVQLPLPLKPQQLSMKAKGWTVEGIHSDGATDNQLQFQRLQGHDERGKAGLEAGVLPPFLLVERTILLGLTWKVETRVSRLSPGGTAVALELPLLQGESVTSEEVHSRNGRVQLNLAANQDFLAWESFLDRADQLTLLHAKTESWTEIWRVEVSPIYHLEYVGIPVILHQQGDRWHPTWRPWPGEEVKLTISRPEGVTGQTLTIDKATLATSPGKRVTDSTLVLVFRSSQGGQHTIILPPTAELREVAIGGKIQPLRQKGRNLTLPINPGYQEITIKWREPLGIATLQKSPEVNLGIPSVNSNLEMILPDNRWPLWVGGPRLGPAVLFWSVLLIIVLAAFGLSRTGLTPLKFHQWLLLGIGMSQSNIYGALLVVGWLVILDLRGKAKAGMNREHFNAMQVVVILFTLLALAALIGAISRGLLGHPDMNIVGNGSSRNLLRWYQDHSDPTLPGAWLLSIPLYFYRLAMLAWALWISFALIGIVNWGWQLFSQPVLWYKSERKATPPVEKGAADHDQTNKRDAEPEPVDLSRELKIEED